MRAFQPPAVACAALLVLAASAAEAATVVATDGRFEAQVSAKGITRIAVAGEKVATVRKTDDAQGPKMSVDVDGATGDVFVEFDGDVIGRAFTAFLTTQSGKTVEAVLSPRNSDGQTVFVRLAADETAAAVAHDGADEAPAPAVEPSAGPRQAGYPQLLTALVRLMFNDSPAPGVVRSPLNEPVRRAGAFEIRAIESFSVGDLKGTVVSLRNTSPVGQPLYAKVFLTPGVLAAAVTHQTVASGAYARVYIVEGGRP
jgi:hypothetical protein